MTRRAAGIWVLAGVLLVAAGCHQDAQSDGRSAPAGAAAPPPRPAAVATPPIVARRQVTERAWWNQDELIQALQLTDTQRAEMDALLLQAESAWRVAQKSQRQGQRQLRAAIATGDWDTARQASRRVADGMAAVWSAQSNLKIDVLSRLTSAQQQTLAAKYRYVLSQTSVFGRRRARVRRGAGRPPAVRP